MVYLNIACIRECTEAEGPGKRFALWCQGCLKNCAGCCNDGMRSIEKKEIYEVEQLINLINDAGEKFGIEGITLLGGEPLLQSRGLYEIAKWCRENDLSVMIYTGYTTEEIDKLPSPWIKKLLKYTDIVIDGPYIKELYDYERSWIGSTNQKVTFNSKKYGEESFKDNKRSMEVCIGKEDIRINGWPFEA